MESQICDSCNGEAKRWWTLTVQSPAGTPGADGQVDLTDSTNWTTEGSIRANFVSKGGREFVQANQVQADNSTTIETRSTNFTRSILPKWRLLFGSRVIEITSAYDVDEARKTVRIHGTEKIQ